MVEMELDRPGSPGSGPRRHLGEAFLQFNDNTVERGLFYQALNVVLEVELDEEL